jgi:hypothetical protein
MRSLMMIRWTPTPGLLVLLPLLALAAAPATAPAPAPAPDPGPRDHILHANVHEGLVDYQNIKAHDAGALKRYLAELAGVNPAALSRDDRLAFYINLYNATMVQAVLDRYHPGYSPAEKDYAVFKAPLVSLHGKQISLNDLENNLIRKQFQEPRIHVALVCGARSCPPLLNRAYRGDDLEQTLAGNMRRFLNDPARNRIDDQKHELHLSKIFDWYAGDFGGKDHLAAFITPYVHRDVNGWPITFLDYDWTLNAAPTLSREP